jgi:hypothetical protein
MRSSGSGWWWDLVAASREMNIEDLKARAGDSRKQYDQWAADGGEAGRMI